MSDVVVEGSMVECSLPLLLLANFSSSSFCCHTFPAVFFSLAVSAAVWIYHQYADADGWLLPAGGLLAPLAPLAQLAAAPLTSTDWLSFCFFCFVSVKFFVETLLVLALALARC